MFGDIPATISARWNREIINGNGIPKVTRTHHA